MTWRRPAARTGSVFHGDEAAAGRGEKARHFPVAGADFEPGVGGGRRQGLGNSRAPGWIREEVLSEALARHRLPSVAAKPGWNRG